MTTPAIIPSTAKSALYAIDPTNIPLGVLSQTGWITLGNFYINDKPSITMGVYSLTPAE